MEDNYDLVDDGIIDIKKWELANPKILFLLKEATKRSEWTQIAGIPIDTQKGDNPRFWPNVLRWKHAVASAITEGHVPEYAKADEFRKNNRILDDIAYVNVKKQLGGAKSIDRVITKIAFDNRLTLGKQIVNIKPKPNVIFCCYTIEAYRSIYGASELQEAAHKIYIHRSRVVISFYHPANRRSPEDLYDELSLILKQEAFFKQFTAPSTS